MIRTIKLYGDLADICGDSIKLSANCLYDVIAGIRANFPQTNDLFDGGKCRISAGLQKDNETPKWVSEQNCNEILEGINTIHFGIVVTGAGIETAMLIYGYFTAAGLGTILSVALTAISVVAIQVAVGLAVGAISKMFAPKQSRNDKEPKEDKSYKLSGPGQQKGIGTTIPLLYGRYRGGSCIISQSVVSERLVSAIGDSISVRKGTQSLNLLANDGAGDGAYISSCTAGAIGAAIPIFGGNGNYMTVAANGDLVVVIATEPPHTMETKFSYTAAKPGTIGDVNSTNSSTTEVNVKYAKPYSFNNNN